MDEEYDYLYLYDDEDEEPKKKDPWHVRVKQLFYDIHNYLIIGICYIAIFVEFRIIVYPRIIKIRKLDVEDRINWINLVLNTVMFKYYHDGSWADRNLI